jgi:hypothetical protein
MHTRANVRVHARMCVCMCILMLLLQKAQRCVDPTTEGLALCKPCYKRGSTSKLLDLHLNCTEWGNWPNSTKTHTHAHLITRTHACTHTQAHAHTWASKQGLFWCETVITHKQTHTHQNTPVTKCWSFKMIMTDLSRWSSKMIFWDDHKIDFKARDDPETTKSRLYLR